VNAAVRRLTKRDVEDLLERYDEDPIGALSAALRRLLGGGADPDARTAVGPPGPESLEPPSGRAGDADDADWERLVRAAGFGPERTADLVAGDQAALDTLAAELNELRTIAR